MATLRRNGERRPAATGGVQEPRLTARLDDQRRSAIGGGTTTPTSTNITHSTPCGQHYSGAVCPVCGGRLALPLGFTNDRELAHFRCLAVLSGQRGGAA